MSFYSSLMKIACAMLDTKRDRGLTTPAEIKRCDDIPYGEDRMWQMLDVYRPRIRQGKLPVIVSVHGGGWVYGDKERYQFYCMELAQHGFAVVNFSYHLAPKYKYPTQMEDVTLVFRWVREQAETYDFDLSNIFAVGDSAGAHLLSLYCALCTDPDYASRYSLCAPIGEMPKALGLFCGAYDAMPTQGLVGHLMKDLLPGHGQPYERALVTPLRYLNSAFPPVFLATADGDFLKDDSRRLKEELDRLGVQNRLTVYQNAAKPLGHVFHLNTRLPEAKTCNDEICAFFRSQMEEQGKHDPIEK